LNVKSSLHYRRNETLHIPLGFVCHASLPIGIHGGGLLPMEFQMLAATVAIEILRYRSIGLRR
jgi:hypothetical protein